MTFNFSYFTPLSFITSSFVPLSYVIGKWSTHYALQEKAQDNLHPPSNTDDFYHHSPCPILEQSEPENGYMVYNTFRFPLQPYILTNTNFSTLDINTRKFILLHEFGHVENFHVPMMLATELLSLAASLFFFPSSSLPAFFMIQQAALSIINARNERDADDFAIQKSGKDELNGGKEILQYKLNKRAAEWDHATSLSSKINFLWNAFNYYVLQGHPFEEARISKIDQKLTLLKNEIKNKDHKNSNLITA